MNRPVLHKRLLRYGHWYLILLGTLLFVIGALIHERYHATVFVDILFHIAGAFAGAGLIALILNWMGLDEDHDSLLSVQKKITDHPKADVAAWVLMSSKKAARELETPCQTFDDQEDYLRELIPIVEHLKKGERLRAICGDKDWQGSMIQKYFSANYKAIKSGVHITRMFLDDGSYKPEIVDPIMDEHKANRVDVRFIPSRKLFNHKRSYELKAGFGFVIINDDKVLVHNTLKNKKAFLYTHPMIVNEMVCVFDELYALSDEYVNVDSIQSEKLIKETKDVE